MVNKSQINLDRSFGKNHRLLSKNDFLSLKDGASCLKNDSFIVYYKIRNNGFSETRIGISCSKKTGNSVKRNRYKRLIRECFRLSSFKEIGVDLLVVLKAKEKTDEAQVLKKREESLLRNLRNTLTVIGKGKVSVGKNSFETY